MKRETLTLDGPAGILQARVDLPETRNGIAVLCHPHPQYGGSMDDAVLDVAATALLAAGHACLRFNFRGVGDSSGRFDAGRGEVDDALTVLTTARDSQPEGPLFLLGYSFGACVAWNAARRAPQPPDLLLLIAPPVGLMDFSEAPPADIRLHAVLGNRDDFAPLDTVTAWARGVEPAVDVSVIAGADHFFTGVHAALEGSIGEILDGTEAAQ